LTFTAVTGQVTDTEVPLPPLALAVVADELLAVVAVPVDEDVGEVPLVATGVFPKTRSYTVAATRVPLAAVVCSTVVVLAVDVR
jgi:hypothetical protein